jgi:Ca2+-transporting ATPase
MRRWIRQIRAASTASPSRRSACCTRQERGLSQREVESRLTQHGHNEVTPAIPLSARRRFLAQFQDMLVVLLLVATAIWAALWAYERDAALPYEAMATLAVILLNVTKGYIQESRAESALAALRAMSAADAPVSRAGERAIVAADLVSSDVILIEKAIRFRRTNAWANRLRYRRPP